MKDKFSRRDFLKLAGAIPLSTVGARLVQPVPSAHQVGGSPNVIIVVFDALSAYHMSLFGYQRETTPNLARLAERAVVYHDHYSNGSYTTPGTASLLTGTLPWTHRAFKHNIRVDDFFTDKQIFSAFNNYHSLSYTHSPWASTLLKQFRDTIDEYVKRITLFLENAHFIPLLFEDGDEDIAFLSWLRAIRSIDDGYAYSLFFSRLFEEYDKQYIEKYHQLERLYPRGIPTVGAIDHFMLETAIDWFC